MDQVTLVLIKPDGLKKSLTGNILTKLSEVKFRIIAAKIIQVSDELARAHYHELVNEPFFPELVKYIKGEYHTKRVMALVYHGEGCIQRVRELAGATNPEEADSVSIRGAYGRITTAGVFENVIHASSSSEAAKLEIQLWFQPDEIVEDIYPSKDIVREHMTVRVWTDT